MKDADNNREKKPFKRTHILELEFRIKSFHSVQIQMFKLPSLHLKFK